MIRSVLFGVNIRVPDFGNFHMPCAIYHIPYILYPIICTLYYILSTYTILGPRILETPYLSVLDHEDDQGISYGPLVWAVSFFKGL